MLFKAVNQVVQDQAKQIHVYQSLQKANLLILKSIYLERIQKQIHKTKHKENSTHNFLIFEKDEIRFFLNCFRIHNLVIGDVSILVVENQHSISLFIKFV